MTTAPASLAQAYDRIEDDLREVASLFDAELRSDLPEIAELCEHLGRFRGKMLRPAVLLLAAQATGGVCPIHRGLAAVVEMFHLATLVHDDVLDEAKSRRNCPTVNHGWGNEAAVMLGDWLISHAYHLCSRQGSVWASLEISSVAHRTCQGELRQLVTRGNLDVSVEEYLHIISAKTAELIGLSARLGAHFNDVPAPVEAACREYGQDLGIAFQIADDVLDLVGDERVAGKTLRSDLTEGKATLPLICYLQSAPASVAGRMRSLLSGVPGGAGAADGRGRIPADRLAEAHRLLVDSGCVESARAIAQRYVESAKARLDALPPSDPADDLRALADYVLVRNR